MKAIADEVSASLRPRPPVRTGSIAWSHEESGIDELLVQEIFSNLCQNEKIHCLPDQLLQSAKGD